MLASGKDKVSTLYRRLSGGGDTTDEEAAFAATRFPKAGEMGGIDNPRKGKTNKVCADNYHICALHHMLY